MFINSTVFRTVLCSSYSLKHFKKEATLNFILERIKILNLKNFWRFTSTAEPKNILVIYWSNYWFKSMTMDFIFQRFTAQIFRKFHRFNKKLIWKKVQSSLILLVHKPNHTLVVEVAKLSRFDSWTQTEAPNNENTETVHSPGGRQLCLWMAGREPTDCPLNLNLSDTNSYLAFSLGRVSRSTSFCPDLDPQSFSTLLL